jgi:hypothetical protein
MKNYDYRALIQAHIDANRRYFVHEDFEKYYTGLFESLKVLFQINFTFRDFSGMENSFRRKNAEMLFRSTVSSYNHITEPWGAFLEGPAHLDDMWDKYGSKLFDLTRESQTIHLALLDELFQIMYGQVDKIVTSEMLLEIGFDYSKEPKMSDYDDYL